MSSKSYPPSKSILPSEPDPPHGSNPSKSILHSKPNRLLGSTPPPGSNPSPNSDPFAGSSNQKSRWQSWAKTGLFIAGATIGGTVLAVPAATTVLGVAGFGSMGPVLGTAAPNAQAAFFGAAVTKGSWFSVSQSLAMGGTAYTTATSVAGGAVAFAGSTLALLLKKKGEERDGQGGRGGDGRDHTKGNNELSPLPVPETDKSADESNDDGEDDDEMPERNAIPDAGGTQ